MTWEADEAVSWQMLPMVLPSSWRSIGPGQYTHRRGLRVVMSAERETDSGQLWLHVSASAPGSVPSWSEMSIVKDLFIGVERKAIVVLPPRDEHINHHQHVLHLWARLDADIGLPDFRRDLNGELTL